MDHRSPQRAAFRSGAPEKVEELWRTVVGSRVTFDRPGWEASHYHLETARLGGFSVGRQQAGAGVTGVVEPGDSYLAWVPSYGRSVYQRDREEYVSAPNHLLTWRPGVLHRVKKVAVSSELTYLALESWLLERHLENLLDRPISGPITLDPITRLRPGGGQTWWSLLQLASSLMLGDGRLTHRAVLDPLCEAMMTGLLLSVDHQHRDALQRPVRPAGSRSVRCAVDAIHARPEEPYTVTALAGIAGTSVRSLQAAFHTQLGISPMAYLRHVRLARAHQDLVGNDTTTVAEAAHRWGFTHLGRFAAAYAERYGEPPSVTRQGHHSRRPTRPAP